MIFRQLLEDSRKSCLKALGKQRILPPEEHQNLFLVRFGKTDIVDRDLKTAVPDHDRHGMRLSPFQFNRQVLQKCFMHPDGDRDSGRKRGKIQRFAEFGTRYGRINFAFRSRRLGRLDPVGYRKRLHRESTVSHESADIFHDAMCTEIDLHVKARRQLPCRPQNLRIAGKKDALPERRRRFNIRQRFNFVPVVLVGIIVAAHQNLAPVFYRESAVGHCQG